MKVEMVDLAGIDESDLIGEKKKKKKKKRQKKVRSNEK